MIEGDIDNGTRPRVVIRSLSFAGTGGRRDNRIAVRLGAAGALAPGKSAMVDGVPVTIQAAERIPEMTGWWQIEVA